MIFQHLNKICAKKLYNPYFLKNQIISKISRILIEAKLYVNVEKFTQIRVLNSININYSVTRISGWYDLF